MLGEILLAMKIPLMKIFCNTVNNFAPWKILWYIVKLVHNGKICWFKTQNQNIMIMWTICLCLVQVWQSQIETKYNPILLHILIALPCIAELLLRVVGTNSCADKQPGQYYIIFKDPKPLNENLRCTCVYIALRRCCITSSSRAVTIELACVHWNWTRVSHCKSV